MLSLAGFRACQFSCGPVVPSDKVTEVGLMKGRAARSPNKKFKSGALGSRPKIIIRQLAGKRGSIGSYEGCGFWTSTA
jgi:hypothetical protein